MTEGGTLSGAAFSGSSFKLLSSFYFFFVAVCSFATALVNALTDFIKDAICVVNESIKVATEACSTVTCVARALTAAFAVATSVLTAVIAVSVLAAPAVGFAVTVTVAFPAVAKSATVLFLLYFSTQIFTEKNADLVLCVNLIFNLSPRKLRLEVQLGLLSTMDR